MRQYASLFQRVLSLLLITGIVLAALFLGVVFLGYLLVVGAAAFIVGWVYMLFQAKKAKRARRTQTETVFEPGHVESGNFSRGPGRIIEHGDE